MSARFRAGLVVGKLSPLHLGHRLLVESAVAQCEEVLVVSYSKPELPGCGAEARERWLAALFPGVRRLVIDDEGLRRLRSPIWPELPRNDAVAAVHLRFCAFLCEEVARLRPDAVFTSERYGDAFAAELTRRFRARDPAAPEVTHVCVDPGRRLVPVSGTAVRRDVHAARGFLPPEVYASFVDRICVLGGESSGKTTLAAALAGALGTAWVPEYGRELWERRAGRLERADMAAIAREQVAREEVAAGRAVRRLFCDTSPLTTLFYAHRLFGEAAPELERLAERRYDRVILCEPDFPFVQDGTRASECLRAEQTVWYRRELARRGLPFTAVSGTPAERVAALLRLLRGTPAGAR